MHILTEIPFSLDAENLMSTLQIPAEGELADAFTDLLRIAEQHANPKALYKEVYVTARDGDQVDLGGVAFTSRALSHNLSEAQKAFPFIATCGRELDEVFPTEGDFVLEFWWDTIKANLLNTAFTSLHEDMHRRYQLDKTASMSPGSGDATVWPIEQQRALFDLLGDVEGHLGVRLTDSFLMVPNKTVSGIVFTTHRNYQSCQVCHREGCPGRRAPFNQKLWEELQHA